MSLQNECSAFRVILRQSEKNMKDPISKREKTHALILRVAARQFADKGYAATSMETLAKACKLTKGALYDHFNGKADVYLKSISSYLSASLKEIDEKSRCRPDDSAERRVFVYIEQMLKALNEDRVMRRLLLRLLIEADAESAAPVVKNVLAASFNRFRELLQQYRPEINARDYTYSFFCNAILGEDLRKWADILTPETSSLDTSETLIAHFRNSLNASSHHAK